MLKKLSVRNFAVISSMEFEPKAGLNVFTGETGAGKSVAISALSFVLGARGASSFIKDGADKLEVRAEFDMQGFDAALVHKYGLTEKTLVLTRSLDRKSKSKAFINGRAAPAATLAELGRELVDFHGQHEHQSLLRADVQLRLLDTFAGLSQKREQTARAYQAWKETQARLEAAQMSEQEKERLLDLYAFQLKEIENVHPTEGEDLELEQKLPQMKHAGRLLELAGEAYQNLYGQENCAVSLAGRAARLARDMAQLDDNASQIANALENAQTLLSDAAAELSGYQDHLNADPQKLDDMLSRHEKLKRLKLKYGPEISDVLAKAEELKRQIDHLQNSQQREEELREAEQKARQELDALCEDLHAKRTESAHKLAKRLEKEITPLGFAGLCFEISVEMDAANPTVTGADHVEFLFSPNPGQMPRPLAVAASGGELSRVMLGLKTVLAGEVPVMVFDEVDSGVGGRTAALVGRKLREAAAGRQVLCVTHLASVAACADAFFHIEKKTDGKTTDVALKELSGQAVTAEIARMLGASSDNDQTALRHAREMLQRAQNA